MKIVSVNVGVPREITWRGETFRTSIFKTPVSGPVRVARLNIDGDRQSDLSVHGGIDKAVYVYPAEHYAYWRDELPGVELPWGAFGENFTTEGLLENVVQIGDSLGAGSAEFVVTQPRMPCFKLGARFERTDMVKRFLRSGRTGFYLAVAREGSVAPGNIVTSLGRDEQAISVADIVGLYAAKNPSQDLLRRAAGLGALSAGWREHFGKRLEEPGD